MKMNYTSWMTGLCFSLITTMNAHAALPGIYLGAQGGWGNVSDTGISRQFMGELVSEALDEGDFTFTSFKGNTSSNGAAGRLYVGYQFGCMSALEFGWMRFNSVPVKATATLFDRGSGFPGTVDSSGTIKMNAFDLVGKGILPLRYNINVYGKLGLAYLEGRTNASAAVTENGVVSGADNNSDITSRVFPTFGLGIAYDFRPDIEMDVSWNRIQKVGHSEALGSTDLISIGLALHFDKWCIFC